MKSLYRKYRPKKFSDVIGQNNITKTLSNAIKYDRIGHAYLFTGPRGVGKTTIARIFAQAVNCSDSKEKFEPCGKCANCKTISEKKFMDIIEVDAASNTGVENIRELRETINLPPTAGKYKVYIIDEVHMLSTGAFNALLKTLEEPPAHAIFILATTEIHKIPETILSRCQRFDFTRFSLQNIIEKLKFIAKTEKVKIDEKSLELIALTAEGGMRDAESLLSQIMSLEDKNITLKEVEEILGTSDRQNTEKLTGLLLNKNSSQAILLINQLSNDGYDLGVFSKSLLNYIRQILLFLTSPDLAETANITQDQKEKIKDLTAKTDNIELLKLLNIILEARNKIKSSFIPQLPLEMAAIEFASYSENKNPNPKSNQNTPRSNQEDQEKKDDNSQPEVSKQKIAKESTQKQTSSEKEKTPKNKITPKQQFPENNHQSISINQVKNNWKKIISEIESKKYALSAFLSNCKPEKIEDENTLVIAVKYDFYKEKLNEPQNKLTIKETLDNLLECSLKIKIATAEESGTHFPSQEDQSKEKFPAKPRENASLLEDAMNLMGGKIVENNS